MPKFDVRITVSSDKETAAYLNELSIKGNCSLSQAFRNMAAEHKELIARFAALGKRPERTIQPPEVGTGV